MMTPARRGSTNRAWMTTIPFPLRRLREPRERREQRSGVMLAAWAAFGPFH